MSKKVNLKPRAMMYPSPAVIASLMMKMGKLMHVHLHLLQCVATNPLQ